MNPPLAARCRACCATSALPDASSDMVAPGVDAGSSSCPRTSHDPGHCSTLLIAGIATCRWPYHDVQVMVYQDITGLLVIARDCSPGPWAPGAWHHAGKKRPDSDVTTSSGQTSPSPMLKDLGDAEFNGVPALAQVLSNRTQLRGLLRAAHRTDQVVMEGQKRRTCWQLAAPIYPNKSQ